MIQINDLDGSIIPSPTRDSNLYCGDQMSSAHTGCERTDRMLRSFAESLLNLFHGSTGQLCQILNDCAEMIRVAETWLTGIKLGIGRPEEVSKDIVIHHFQQ